MNIVPTEEQTTLVEMSKKLPRLKINALAGAAKTTSLQLIANEVEEKSLYLAFNKAMAEEAKTKFPSWVEVRTTHSLAFKYFGKEISHKLTRPNGPYKNVCGTGGEIAKHLKLPEFLIEDRTITSAGVGLAVKETVNRFEYSADQELSEKHVSMSVVGRLIRLKTFDKGAWVGLVLAGAKELWELRKDPTNNILATHDTYLKLYQLSEPDLSLYRVVYVDEQQDSNACVLDILLRQQTKLVLVGDQFQQIYQFRGSVDALDKVDCEEAVLSQSFRFGPAVAEIANCILGMAGGTTTQLKGWDIESKVCSSGEDSFLDESKHYALLYRTNGALISDAVELLSDGKRIKIEIDMREFIKLLSSVQALHDNNKKRVKHELVQSFDTFAELREEAEGSGGELAMAANLVQQRRANYVLAKINTYVAPSNPDITLTTAHKSKGREWDQVVLAEDFPSVYDKNGEWVGLEVQERNLLYMAVTRAKKTLVYNSTVEDILNRNQMSLQKEGD